MIGVPFSMSPRPVGRGGVGAGEVLCERFGFRGLKKLFKFFSKNLLTKTNFFEMLLITLLTAVPRKGRAAVSRAECIRRSLTIYFVRLIRFP